MLRVVFYAVTGTTQTRPGHEFINPTWEPHETYQAAEETVVMALSDGRALVGRVEKRYEA